MALTAGTVLGQYEICSPLGAGGMGEVYRAHDTRLDREVAIKVLPESLTSDPDRLRRFEQEARAAAALNHTNILAVHQMATHEDVSYMVTELLDGETLRERLRRGPIPLRKTIDHAVQIAHGLAAAHEKGITHRDLKPENLFVTKDGRVKILDFGLARVGPSKGDSGLDATQSIGTEPGMVMGTVGYMSPEQLRGKTADHRSDIFAFGTILYEMVTGKQTFRKPTSADTMSAILNEDPPSISQITPTSPPGLQRVVHRCLEKSPEQRFQSASDMAFALEALSDSARTTSTGGHAVVGELTSRRGIAIAGSALVVLVGLAALAYFWLRPAPAPKVSNYVQLTHDGQPKRLVGMDGSRLYLHIDAPEYLGMGELSTSGGEWKKLPILTSPSMTPLGLSSNGTELLASDGFGVPSVGPLWSFPILGGSPRRLANATGQDGAWSPDGKLLAYSKDRALFIANADGTESHNVLTTKNFIRRVAWSPDGKTLRFDMFRFDAPSELWEVSVDGGNSHALLPGWHSPPEECCGRWTADGRYFVFVSQHQIWALARKASLFQATPKPVQLTFSPVRMISPLPSNDGKKLYVVGATLRGELMSYDQKRDRFLPFLGGISAEYVALSNDGRHAAYVSYPEGILWRVNVDGSERTQLSYPPAQALNPRWSPDGEKIVYFENYPDKPARIFEVADGGEARPLMPEDTSQQSDPNWSPDGNKVVFAGRANDATSEIRVLDLSSHQITVLPGSRGLFSPRWSPQGRYVVALSGDLRALLLFDFETNKWTDLAKGSFNFPLWGNDGKYVYVIDSNGPGAVIKIDIASRKAERAVDLKNFIPTGYYGVWLGLTSDDSPLMLRNTGTDDIYSLDWEEN